MTPGPGWRKCTAYRQTGPGGLPLALRLSEGLGITEQAGEIEVLCFELVEPFMNVLLYLPGSLVLALPVQPDAALADIDAFLVLMRILEELSGGHDPYLVVTFRVEDEEVRFSYLVSNCREQCSVTCFDGLGASFDLDLDKLPVWPLDNSIYCIIIDQWHVHVHALLEHQSDNPVFNALAETGGMAEGKGHYVCDA